MLIEDGNEIEKLVKYSRQIEDEMPWLYDNFYGQFDTYHINLINEIYNYSIKYIASEQYESGKHPFKNIYVIGSWFGLHLYSHFVKNRKNPLDKLNFTFIDRNRDYIKAIDIMSELFEDTDIKSLNADVVFDEIDFSKADLVIMPYAEEIMPIQYLDLNIKCPVVAAFTEHRYQRIRNRNFAEPLELISDVHMENNERVYLKKLGDVDDWVYADIVTIIP